jgi:hypothetical protein
MLLTLAGTSPVSNACLLRRCYVICISGAARDEQSSYLVHSRHPCHYLLPSYHITPHTSYSMLRASKDLGISAM